MLIVWEVKLLRHRTTAETIQIPKSNPNCLKLTTCQESVHMIEQIL